MHSRDLQSLSYIDKLLSQRGRRINSSNTMYSVELYIQQRRGRQGERVLGGFMISLDVGGGSEGHVSWARKCRRQRERPSLSFPRCMIKLTGLTDF